MRSMLLLTALAVGVAFAPASATERVASAGETPAAPAGPVITTIGKSIDTQATPASAEPTIAAPQSPAEPNAAEKPKPPAPPSVQVKINLATQRMDVAVHGTPAHTWAISSGRQGFETPRGTFKPQWVAKMWYSQKYDLAPMPHAVFINGGVAVHATSSVGMLGQPASHGCIRLAPANAATFYGLVQKHGLGNVRVSVFGTPPAPRIAKATPDRRTPQMAPSRVAGGALIPAQSGPSGMVHLRPGSPYHGTASFEHNGVRYVRVR